MAREIIECTPEACAGYLFLARAHDLCMDWKGMYKSSKQGTSCTFLYANIYMKRGEDQSLDEPLVCEAHSSPKVLVVLLPNHFDLATYFLHVPSECQAPKYAFLSLTHLL